MTNAEHLIENAITCMTNGKEYEFFARQSINREVEWYDYKLKSWDCEGYSYTDEKFWGFFPELPEVNE